MGGVTAAATFVCPAELEVVGFVGALRLAEGALLARKPFPRRPSPARRAGLTNISKAVAPTLSQNGKSKRFGSILSQIEKLLSQQLTPSSLVRSRADKRLASAIVRMADRENSFLPANAPTLVLFRQRRTPSRLAPPASFLCGLGRPRAADCIFLRRPW